MPPDTRKQSASHWLPLCLLGGGFLARLLLADWGFLNPDEAAHYLLSVQPSLALAYKASLTTAHPPLLILLLHYWQLLGSSELVLRLPSVVAGTVFCWVMFAWLQRVADRATALIGLSLFVFLPSLVFLSAEIRQYSLLLVFAALSLYSLDTAISKNSARQMAVSQLALYCAMLSHYSSLLFALSIGIYGVVRLVSVRARRGVIAVWIAGQIAALALAAFLFTSHVSRLEARNLPQQIADTWLRSSIFHRGEDHLAVFVAKANIRLFHYVFSNSVVGVLGLLLFLAGLAMLLKDRAPLSSQRRPMPRQLGLLLAIPFVINCAAAVAGLYPYGGTRHNAFLIAFAVPAMSIALARWKPSKNWTKPLVIAAALLSCYIFPSPTGAYMQPRNQAKALMGEAVMSLRQSVPPGSVLFTDYQSGLLLSYYACSGKVVQFDPPFQPFLKSRCGDVQIISTQPRLWIFQPENFTSALHDMQQTYGVEGDAVWVFQAGWLVNAEPEMRAQFRDLGCRVPRNFGENIFLCQLASGPSGQR